VEKDDCVSYVHNHLQLLTPDKSRTDADDRYIIATDRDRIDVELEPYIVEEDIIMDLNKYSFVLANIELIKKPTTSNNLSVTFT
jgi:hypothetical protein